jgi:hypothetical protein
MQKIISKPGNKKYREEYDRIFGANETEQPIEEEKENVHQS